MHDSGLGDRSARYVADREDFNSFAIRASADDFTMVEWILISYQGRILPWLNG
jgi:hypothetical protein